MAKQLKIDEILQVAEDIGDLPGAEELRQAIEDATTALADLIAERFGIECGGAEIANA